MEEAWLVQGQAEIWQHLLAYADSTALQCVVDLGVADIIHKNGTPMTLKQIAAQLPTKCPDIHLLHRIMRLLVGKQVFAVHSGDDKNAGDEPRYTLTPASKWMMKGGEFTLAPMILLHNHPSSLSPWQRLSKCVDEGGVAFEKDHGVAFWDHAVQDPHFGHLFNSAMACTAHVVTKAVIAAYKGGFRDVGTLVDVGGGTGEAVGEILEAYPHIKAINVDLPHIVAAAPERAGVTHVAGDVFGEIPKADCVFMKRMLHGWNDAECVRILKNVKKALPEATGKLVLVEIVLKPEENGIWGDTQLRFDLMMAVLSTGKERTEMEWKNLLHDGGFHRHNIISLPFMASIIEAFPN